MCRQVQCKTCKKTTWAGCGQHVEATMRNVPNKDRCQGHEAEPKKGFFKRLFG
ncbi:MULTISPECIES: hypothetical protein [Glutamicibacter]|jgi:hypothetical protein|uniref:Uncharacterized protein n=1 Tax=Glutamicibacter arilaitensis (strain DSM 16368 / CIP 108037 / IAM 15318 / JCM 13566 / NCIMB 14258 / Re117) TaxID=861360 RepID=A0ABM9PT73_GLUAR|nr:MULTISPECIES: hypothetical protein [Glutamicibacter]CBT74381.1 conserved hypothetical protein [Glutamicibacter arilaitensis Re117]